MQFTGFFNQLFPGRSLGNLQIPLALHQLRIIHLLSNGGSLFIGALRRGRLPIIQLNLTFFILRVDLNFVTPLLPARTYWLYFFGFLIKFLPSFWSVNKAKFGTGLDGRRFVARGNRLKLVKVLFLDTRGSGDYFVCTQVVLIFRNYFVGYNGSGVHEITLSGFWFGLVPTPRGLNNDHAVLARWPKTVVELFLENAIPRGNDLEVAFFHLDFGQVL